MELPTAIGEKGFMCVTKPWPSMIRTIWNDGERFKKSYFGDCVKMENLCISQEMVR